MPETGFLFQPYTTIRSILANSDTFQSWVGAADSTEALDYIFLYETRDGLFDLARYAVIVPPGARSPNELRRVGGQGGRGLASFDRSWAIRVGFLEELSSGYSEAATQSFLSTVGGVLDDILSSDLLGNVDDLTQTPDSEEPFRWREGQHDGYQVYFTIGASI